jgi:signal transduction histidine kinase
LVIRLQKKASGVRLEVSDNGVGLAKSRAGRGLGLGVMRHRAVLIGGTLGVRSKRGRGTTVICTTVDQP